MKNLILITITVLFFAVENVQAQPFCCGMYQTIKPESIICSPGAYKIVGKFVSYYPSDYKELEENYQEKSKHSDRLHVAINEKVNFSLYDTNIKTSNTGSLFFLYGYEFAMERALKAKLLKTGTIVRDTITTGTLYFGNSTTPKEKKDIISSGAIIIMYDVKTGIVEINMDNVWINDDKGVDILFVLPK